MTHRNAALVGEVEREEGDDEPAESVDERAAPQEPVGGRESLGEGGEEVFAGGRRFLFHPENYNRCSKNQRRNS